MNCSNCGYEISENARFCENCGKETDIQPMTPEEAAQAENEAKCLNEYEKFRAKLKRRQRRHMLLLWVGSLIFALASVVFRYFSGDNWWKVLVFVSVPLAVILFIIGIKCRFTKKPADKEQLEQLNQAYENAKNDGITEK